MRHSRSSGVSLILSLIFLIVLLGIVGSFVTFSTSDQAMMIESRDNSIAFYLAEGAIDAAKWEIAESQDPGGDGPGNRSGSVAAGTYSVAAADLGGNLYRFDGGGSVGRASVTIEEVAELVVEYDIPEGAMTLVGGTQTTQILLSSSTNISIDGVDAPGIAVYDANMYSTIGSQFAAGVGPGYISESDITGSVTNQFGGHDLSIQEVATNPTLTFPEGFYADARGSITSNFYNPATSKTLGSSSSITYGSSGSPVLYKFPKDSKLQPGQTLTGYGTLVFRENFVIESGATLNWNGNIIIYGMNGNDAFFDIDGGVNLNGNITVIGNPAKNIRFLIKSLGQVTVDGAVTLLTDYNNLPTKAEFYVENDFTVNGLVTALASIHQTEFKPGSDTRITGSFVYGQPHGANPGTVTQLKFDQNTEIIYDPSKILSGAVAQETLGINYGIGTPSNGKNSSNFVRRSWTPVYGY